MLDILIRNGWVADGTGNPRYPADVAIRGEQIVDVGRLAGAQAARVIDATGKIVCPGFVDAHSHSDWTILRDCFFDVLAAAGPRLDACGMVGRLFTEAHMAEMVRHPLFSLGVDGATSRTDGPLSVSRKHQINWPT